LLRRQSSLDTYDRLPSRKIDEYYHGYLPRGAPSPPPARRRVRRDEYEAIRIPERESRYRERVEEVKPYPRKGKTRMPRKLVHTRAIREYGYPYEEEVWNIVRAHSVSVVLTGFRMTWSLFN
jgi:hypothetical protein